MFEAEENAQPQIQVTRGYHMFTSASLRIIHYLTLNLSVLPFINTLPLA